jgi:hypothetical protein
MIRGCAPERDQALGFGLLGEFLADRAVDDLPGVLGILEEVG